MTAPVSCPDPADLAAMLDEALPATRQRAVQQHVDQCADCQCRLDALLAQGSGEPLSLGMLGAPGEARGAGLGPGTLPSSAPCTASKSRISSYPFLAPTQDPAAHGRLGHYDVLDVVGRGGMGIVFKARDTHLARIVAIKALASEL